MLTNKWFDGADKKFMFINYGEDVDHKYSVKIKKDMVTYKCPAKKIEDKIFYVRQGKLPNLAFRFYLIQNIMGREYDYIDYDRIQLVIDDGFKDEKQELIEQEKMRSLEQIAKAAIEKKEEQKLIQMKKTFTEQ